MDPTAQALHEVGDAHATHGRLDAALEAYAAAAKADRRHPVPLYNVGNILRLQKRFDEAIAAYDQAVQLKPDFAQARHNRAISLLHIGRLPEGFAEYEWRKLCPGYDDPRYHLPNQWAGQPLEGKRLFVYPELYQGDVIQFVRYVRFAEQIGAQVSLAAPRPMHALLRTISPSLELLDADANPGGFDFVSALMSLPAMFGTTLENIPAAPRYLFAEPARVARWRERIGADGFKVGVAWQGGGRGLGREFPLAELAPLAKLPGVRLVSLQKHSGLDQLASLPSGMRVETLGDDFDPGPDAFVDTAGAMQAVDLVVTLDTSVAHLAGALGVPTWIALPELADWRWFEGRSDSPWYPGVRLFRQAQAGDWPAVFQSMAQALSREASLRR